MKIIQNVHHPYHQIDILIKKKLNRFLKRKHGHQVAGQMAGRNHVIHAYDLYVASCD
jgi:hypothetical protein